MLTIGAIKADHVCDNTPYSGCGPGEYNCTPWGGYPCESTGTSESKEGDNGIFYLCVTKAGEACVEKQMVCQVDIYYRTDICESWCNDFKRYTDGCDASAD